MSEVNDDLRVKGRLTPKFFDPPAGCITDLAVSGSTQLAATKLVHQHHERYSQPNTTATAVTLRLHSARKAGTVAEFLAGSIAKCTGDSTVTLDLKKNNVSVLTTPIVLDSGNTNRVDETATISPGSENYVAGDWFDLVMTISAGTGTLATGVSAVAVFNENSQ
jgi:hypothetical protein